MLALKEGSNFVLENLRTILNQISNGVICLRIAIVEFIKHVLQ